MAKSGLLVYKLDTSSCLHLCLDMGICFMAQVHCLLKKVLSHSQQKDTSAGLPSEFVSIVLGASGLTCTEQETVGPVPTEELHRGWRNREIE